MRELSKTEGAREKKRVERKIERLEPEQKEKGDRDRKSYEMKRVMERERKNKREKRMKN